MSILVSDLFSCTCTILPDCIDDASPPCATSGLVVHTILRTAMITGDSILSIPRTLLLKSSRKRAVDFGGIPSSL